FRSTPMPRSSAFGFPSSRSSTPKSSETTAAEAEGGGNGSGCWGRRTAAERACAVGGRPATAVGDRHLVAARVQRDAVGQLRGVGDVAVQRGDDVAGLETSRGRRAPGR